MFGCVSVDKPWRAQDGTTDRYYCDRTDMHNDTTGIIVAPEHGKLSIAKSLRLYASDRCQNCDPVNYILEGRTDATAPWDEIASGELPLIADGLGRNSGGLQINSTYAGGDSNLSYTEVHFHSNIAAYFEYKLTFPGTRNPTSNSLRFAEVELPGMLLPPEPSVNPTSAPSTSPTKSPSESPSLSPTANPTSDLPDDGVLVTNILEGSSAAGFGCVNDAKAWKSFDKSTNKYYCDRTGLHDQPAGIIISPEHGQLTIPKALRLYTSSGCMNCHPQSFILEGRAEANAPWDDIASGELPGIAEGLDKNSQGLQINSSYASGDPNLTYTQVHFHGHSAPYLEYKLTFELRSPTSNTLHYAEIEVPGMVLPGA